MKGLTFELIEDGQILLVTSVGVANYKKSLASVAGVLEYAKKVKEPFHLIADMSKSTLLPEAHKVLESEVLREVEKHPMLGIETMVVGAKNPDRMLTNIVMHYNILVSQDKILSPDGTFSRENVFFDSVEDAKHFLLMYNQIWGRPKKL